MGVANSTFELFDVSLTEGTVAPPFQLPDYASELALCQRYYRKIGGQITGDVCFAGYGTGNTMTLNVPIPLTPVMRAAPSVAEFGTISKLNVSTSLFSSNASIVSWELTPTAAGFTRALGNIGGFSFNARL